MHDYLITTQLQDTWRLTDKNYVLNYNALNIYKIKNDQDKFIILEPYGMDIETIKKDNEYVEKLSEIIQNELSKELNKLHNVNFSNRYWKIITGNWLKRVIKIIFFRYKCIEKSLSLNLNLFTTASSLHKYKLFTKDSRDLVFATIDSEWNYNLISKILRKNFSSKIKIENYETQNNYFSNITQIKKNKNFYKKLLFSIYKKAHNISYFIHKNNKFFIKDSSFSKFSEIKINLLLKQFPAFYFDEINVPFKYEDNLRDKLDIYNETNDELEKTIRYLVPSLIPTSYLENYDYLKRTATKIKWPEKPQAIVTSNAYDFNELFKIWAASKIEQGTKYFILQHGSLTGNANRPEDTNEYQVCDKFFNWGTRINNKKNISAFNFKLTGVKRKKKKKIKILVLCKSRSFEHEVFDRSFEYKNIFSGIKKLVEILPREIIDNMSFRIKENMRENEEKDFLISKNINLVKSNDNIFKYVTDSDLVIHMYNSTGVFECLSLNVPTMFFWPDYQNSRNQYDDRFVEFCKKKKILFDSIELLAENLITTINDIEKWWNQKDLQKNREIICEQYSVLPDQKSLKDLSIKLFNEKN